MPANHELTYRPLLAGAAIINPQNGVPGTLGCLLTDGSSTFLLSCYHVLGRFDRSVAPDREPIWQATPGRDGQQVASLDMGRSSIALDTGIAIIDGGLPVSSWHIGIGPIRAVTAGRLGQRLVTAGAATGISEGVVVSISAGRIIVEAPPTYPHQYVPFEPGDSGSVWCDIESRSAVAMHTGVDVSGRGRGVELEAILNAVNLELVP